MTVPVHSREHFKALLDEIETFDPAMYESTLRPKARGDEPLASIKNDDLCKKLYSAMTHSKRETETLALQLKYDRENATLYGQAREWDQKHDVYRELFWYVTRMATGLFAAGGSISIRKGWDICQSNESEDPLQHLRRILEGGE